MGKIVFTSNKATVLLLLHVISPYATMVLQLYWIFGALQAFTGIRLTIDTHLCMAILIFHAMHLTA